MKKEARKKILKKLATQQKLNKIASAVVEDVNKADNASGDEFAHKIFQKLLENIYIEELED